MKLPCDKRSASASQVAPMQVDPRQEETQEEPQDSASKVVGTQVSSQQVPDEVPESTLATACPAQEMDLSRFSSQVVSKPLHLVDIKPIFTEYVEKALLRFKVVTRPWNFNS